MPTIASTQAMQNITLATFHRTRSKPIICCSDYEHEITGTTLRYLEDSFAEEMHGYKLYGRKESVYYNIILWFWEIVSFLQRTSSQKLRTVYIFNTKKNWIECWLMMHRDDYECNLVCSSRIESLTRFCSRTYLIVRRKTDDFWNRKYGFLLIY